MEVHRKNATIILNLTSDCNFSCKYCFEGQFVKDEVARRTEINNDFLSAIPRICKLVKEVSEWNANPKTRILLHGGEPLLITAESYTKLFEAISEISDAPYYMMQTNGSLITDEYIDIFEKYAVRVGISIDGPAKIHDKYRLNKASCPTHEIVLKAIQKMIDRGLCPGGMSTITAESIKDPESIYSFFCSHNMDFQFNPIFAGATKSCDDNIYITARQYADFCKELFKRWITDNDSSIAIHNFQTIIRAFITENAQITTCTFNENCFDAFVAMDINGNLYHCHRTVGEKQFCVGNIESMTVEEFMKDGEYMSTRWELLKDSDCKNCPNGTYCYGGCPYNAFLYKGSFFKKDFFCEAYRDINITIYNYLKSYEKSE